ncbi:ABC transporter ATP-binding protein [Dactylosporangium sp. CA-092794]|uniref:ABC transporter ATP-binding protein n=1 Tax=Dactylosporangium sp. CA-092794 TaxID=3239929 RepID=UPI003D8FD43A
MDPSLPAGPLLEVDSLRTTYRRDGRTRTAVRGVSFAVGPGEVVGIVGESGSGKSTALMSVLGLLPPNAEVVSGRVVFAGEDLRRAGDARLRAVRGHEIGLVPQRPMTSLSPVARVRGQLRRYLRHHRGVDRAEADRVIAEMLHRVGLDGVAGRLDDYPHQFSGGQLQRLLIALAAVGARPRLLFADEPTTTLDPTVAGQILRLMRTLRDELGLAIVFVSHDLRAVAQLCDRVYVMYAGEMVEEGDVASVFRRPRHPYTRALLDSIPGRHRPREPMPVLEGSVTSLPEQRHGCSFAPRCAIAVETCRTTAPPLRAAAGGLVACHLYQDGEGEAR